LKYTSEEWKLEGLCRTVDPELWFPEKGSSAPEAKRLCRRCPVIQQCLAYALENREIYGVWGGHTANELKLLRQRLRRMRNSGNELRPAN
jgi:WhiB family redox-sensing transcriptional regulator